MPETSGLAVALRAHQRRLRLASVAWAVLLGSVAACLAAILSGLTGLLSASQTRVTGGVIFAAIAGLFAAVWWKVWTRSRVAGAIESRVDGLDNVVVTAEEIGASSRTVHPVLHDALFDAAVTRVAAIPPARVQPLALPAALATLGAATTVFVLAWGAGPRERADLGEPRTTAPAAAPAPGGLRATITPPAYTNKEPAIAIDPPELTALEGSRIRLEVSAADGPLRASEPGGEIAAFHQAGDRWIHELTADRSRILVLERPDRIGGEGDRLLHIRVEPDRQPLVRILTPAKDLIFGEPRGQVAIEIEARDDLALRSMALRYTRVSGSGETFTFEEAEAPLRVETEASGHWRGRATLTLDRLGLGDGDTVVYRATAADGNPASGPVSSDSFLIEIGRLAGVASTGFAIPEERDRQAISQQMLIIKTERLHAERPRLARDALEERSRMLAIEQRMVKAEFVFMTGGEVADEIEEAAHAHELVEGRFENAAQIELLTAIREMSRAEARLNAADTGEALRFERAALAALQRAFDRRRYLLRTLPERTRIDETRRLSGNRAEARAPSRAAGAPTPDPAVERAREVMRDLAGALASGDGVSAGLAARVLAVDPASEPLQAIAARLAAARGSSAATLAARDAQAHLSTWLRARLAAAPHQGIDRDPLAGRLADELSRKAGAR